MLFQCDQFLQTMVFLFMGSIFSFFSIGFNEVSPESEVQREYLSRKNEYLIENKELEALSGNQQRTIRSHYFQ